MRLRKKEKRRLLNERKRMWSPKQPKAWKLIITLGKPGKKLRQGKWQTEPRP
jgi:hypothetical protein